MRGDQSALTDLLTAYQKPVFNVCLRMLSHREDALEVAQETMLKIVEHIGDFNGRSDIGTWITRIAMNLSVSRLRRRKLRHTQSLDAGSNGSASQGNWQDDQSTALRQEIADQREQGPDWNVQQREMIAYLQTAMTLIDDEFRAVLVLRDIDEMDYQQIAEVLSVPVGTVKSRLFRARLALRQEMFKLCPPDAKAVADGEESTANGSAEQAKRAKDGAGGRQMESA